MNGHRIELINEWIGGCTSGRMGGWAILCLPQFPKPTKKLDLTKQAPPAIDRLGNDGESRRRLEDAKKKGFLLVGSWSPDAMWRSVNTPADAWGRALQAIPRPECKKSDMWGRAETHGGYRPPSRCRHEL